MSEAHLLKINKELDSLKLQLDKSRHLLKVSDACKDLRDWSLERTAKDPLLSNWEGENLFISSGHNCGPCSIQ